MTWEELYPILKELAQYAVLRYEEPERRKDKIQELVCQSYELYKSYIERGKPIRKQDFKAFVNVRAKQVDVRSIVKGGYGGTSTIDVLSFYRRRPNSSTPVISFDDYMTFRPKSKENVESALCFHIDYQIFLANLTDLQKQILDFLIQGYRASKIAEMIHANANKVRQIIKELQESFVRFFKIKPQYA